MPKYGVYSGPYFPIFSPNTGKCGPEKTPYLDIFHTVLSDRAECIIILALHKIRKKVRIFFLLRNQKEKSRLHN